MGHGEAAAMPVCNAVAIRAAEACLRFCPVITAPQGSAERGRRPFSYDYNDYTYGLIHSNGVGTVLISCALPAWLNA